MNYNLYLVFKGFDAPDERAAAEAFFAGIKYEACDVLDNEYDIGAYRVVASIVSEERICFVNSYAQPSIAGWLDRLAANQATVTTGLAGATGSFESLRDAYTGFPHFPNPHIRSNAFVIDRLLFKDIAGSFQFRSKLDAFQFESGSRSLTRQVLGCGLHVVIVGRDGRGYTPEWWPSSQSFRQGGQENLLVSDNQTRAYDAMTWAEKRDASIRTWGRYLATERVRLPYRPGVSAPTSVIASNVVDRK